MSAHWNDKSRGEQIVDFIFGLAVLVILCTVPVILILIAIGLVKDVL